MTSPRRRAADAPEVLVALDAADARPLHQQIADGLRDAILGGRLPPDARVPSTRSLAADLRVARTTVAVAFDQLRAEGYIEGRRGGGTRVKCTVPESVGPRARRRAVAAPGGMAPARLSRRGALLAAAGRGSADEAGTTPVPFRLGVPALDQFPTALWSRLAARHWRRGSINLADGDPGGERALREAIAEYVTVARGASCTAAQVIVVAGTYQAIDLVTRLLLEPGDAAWFEDPGYRGGQVPLEVNGTRIVPVPVDAQGIVVSEGERLAPDARLAYVTPSHQFPLGGVLSAERRLALIEWARRTGAWIVEDDYDSEFRYTGRPLPCLQGLDVERLGAGVSPCVLYVGTFSKTLIPALRLAYLIVPESLVEPARAARAMTERHAPTASQAVLADFIGEGHYARHVRRVRALYAERQGVLLDAARAELGDRLLLQPHQAGLHLVGFLPDSLPDVDVVARARDAGIRAYALSRYYASASSARNGLVLGYAGFDDEALRRAVRGLGQVVGG